MAFIRKRKVGNAIYLEEVESKRVNGKIVQKFVRYIGKQANDIKDDKISISDISVENVKIYGPLLALHSVALEYNLQEILGEYNKEILSIVYAHCLNYKSVNQMSQWFQRTDLSNILGVKSISEKKILKALDMLNNIDPENIENQILKIIKSKHASNREVIFDVTNTYTYSNKCVLAKFGKDKQKIKGRKLIQIGLAILKDTGIPLFHQVLEGNVNDSKIFRDAITRLKQNDFNDNVILFDRGITSKQNQTELSKENIRVLCGMPLRNNIKKLYSANKDNIVSIFNRIKLKSTTFYAKSFDDIFDGVKGKLIFCLNPYKKKTVSEARYEKILEAKKLLEEKKEIADELKKYFDKDKNIIEDVIFEDEKFEGVSCIFTTEKYSNDEAVKKYFEKDLIEKTFSLLKSTVRVRPIRHWLEDRVKAQIMVCYLSILLLSTIEYKLKKIDISVEAALLELESLYRVNMMDKKSKKPFTKVVTFTKKQDEILSLLGVTCSG